MNHASILAVLYLASVSTLSLSQPRELWSMKAHGEMVLDLALSEDRSLVVSGGGDGKAIVWDLKARQPLDVFAHDSTFNLYAAAIVPGDRIVSASRDVSLYAWQLGQSGMLKSLSGHDQYVSDIQALPWRGQFVTAGTDAKLVVWDAATLESVKVVEPRHVTAVAPIEGTGRVVIAGLHGVEEWDLDSGSLVRKFESNLSAIGVAISPGGDYVASSLGVGTKKVVRVWRRNGQLIRTYYGHPVFVYRLTFINDQLIATCGYKHSVQIWNALSGRKLADFGQGLEPIAVASLRPQKRLAVGDGSGTLRVYDISDLDDPTVNDY